MLQRLPDELLSLLTVAAAQGEAVDARLWLVGGVVRDMLLALPPGRDIDLAVEGEVGAVAEALAAATGGRVVAAHAPFGTATVAVPAAAARYRR
ncbi:MAG: CCA tRNA nucleotidyltransferase, partial [Chloroflexales bacterium]|nr:CCA tRNA nucleotidyltransferase [Chloroflexales bacterium]